MADQVKRIRISQIETGLNARQHFNEQALQELADSIKEHGLLQPISVRQVSKKPVRYQLIAGERRVRATELSGGKVIDAISKVYTDEQAQSLMLLENIQRQPFDALEEATGFTSYMATFECDEKALAAKIGKPVEYVKRRLSLLKLRDNIAHMVARGQFPIGHAEAIVDLDPDRQMLAVKIYDRAKAMPLIHFLAVVADLREEAGQEMATPLLDLEAYWFEKADEMAETPRRGKHAVVPVPTRPDLPQVVTNSKDTVADIVMRYVQQLEAAGSTPEAAAVGNLMTALVHSNYLSVPVMQ